MARTSRTRFSAATFQFVWHGVVRRDLRFTWGRSPRYIVAGMVLAYALLYPLAVMATGHRYPAMPTFGVPCPTTILTIGFLLTMETRARWSIAVIPLMWAGIGGSAALLLDMRPDAALLIAGAILIVQIARQARAFPV